MKRKILVYPLGALDPRHTYVSVRVWRSSFSQFLLAVYQLELSHDDP